MQKKQKQSNPNKLAGQNLTAVTNSPHVSAAEFLFGADVIEKAADFLWQESEAPDIVPPDYAPGYAPEDIDITFLTTYANNVHRSYRLWQGHRLIRSAAGTAEQKQAEAEDVKKELEHCLKEVPQEYFDPEFKVGACRVLLNTDKKNSHTALLQMEKLSHYLDLVEVNLLRQIYFQSDSFFEALENIQNIHTDVTTTISSISDIRQNIKHLHDCSIAKAMKVVKSRTRKKNIEKVSEICNRIRTILLWRDQVRDLMETNNFGAALQMIQEAQKIMDTELKGLTCLNNVRSYFEEVTNQTKGKLIDQFLELAARVDDTSQETKERIEVLLRAITEMGELNQLLRHYLKHLKDDILQTVKAVFFESMEDPPAESLQEDKDNLAAMNSQLTHYIQTLDHEKFLSVWEILFNRLNDRLQRVTRMEKLVASAVKSCISDPSELRPHLKFVEQVRLIPSEFALQRCSKILTLREEVHSNLTLADIKEIVVKTMTFIRRAEKLAGQSCYEIRGTIIAQTKNFLESFHRQRLDELGESLDSELWNMEKIPTNYQSILKHNFQEVKHESSIPVSLDLPDWDAEPAENDESEMEASEAAEFVDSLHVEAKGERLRFFLVKSSILLVRQIREYVEVCESLKAIAPDVLDRLLKLIRNFNMRTYKLVLCAGAMTQVGLKSIAARHLSLSYSSIHFLDVCLPRLIEPFLEQVDSKRRKLLRTGLEGALKDIGDHQKSLHEKLVGIMESLIDMKCEELKKCSWVIERPGPDEPLEMKPDEPIFNLMKQTKKMHKVLTQYLGEHKRNAVFRQVTAYFASKFFGTLECLVDENDRFVRNRLFINAKFVLEKLKKLDCTSEELTRNLSTFTI